MSGYKHKPPPNLLALQTQWTNEAQKRQEAIEAAHRQWEKLVDAARIDSSRTPEATAAALAELKAGQAYNAFLDKDREYNREGDSEDRILNTRNNLSPLERHQIETTRNQKWVMAGEFQLWKTAQGLKYVTLIPVNTDSDTHYPDGHTERRGTPQVLATNTWDHVKQAGERFAEIVKEGPPNAFNQALREGLIGLGLRRVIPKLPAGTDHVMGKYAWGKAQSEAKGATDPAGDTCRLIYPSSRSLEDLKKYGAVDVIQDPLRGTLHVVDIDRKLLEQLLPGGLDSLASQPSLQAAASKAFDVKPSANQQTQIEQFKQALGARLSRHGMSSEQIETLAAASVVHHTKQPPGSVQEGTWYALSNDGTGIAVRYPPGVLTEMSVAHALERTPSEHLSQANQNDSPKAAQTSETRVVAMNDSPTEGTTIARP